MSFTYTYILFRSSVVRSQCKFALADGSRFSSLASDCFWLLDTTRWQEGFLSSLVSFSFRGKFKRFAGKSAKFRRTFRIRKSINVDFIHKIMRSFFPSHSLLSSLTSSLCDVGSGVKFKWIRFLRKRNLRIDLFIVYRLWSPKK